MDITPYYNLAIKAALKAGKVLLDHYSADFRIAYKGVGKTDLVTEIDLLAQKTIEKLIHKQYPDHEILGEEDILQGKKKKATKSDFRWIIDPIDGTVNYAHGYPFYCISIALEYKGNIVVGVVYAPHLDELYTAAKGNGAFLNNIPIVVSTVRKLDEAMLATGFTYTNRSKNIPYFKKLLLKTQALRRDGSAALDLCFVAAGRLDAYWEFNGQPWDIAAGSLILQEAGGSVTMLDGSPLRLDGREMAASNGILHKQLIKNLQEVAVQTKLKKASDKKKVPMNA